MNFFASDDVSFGHTKIFLFLRLITICSLSRELRKNSGNQRKSVVLPALVVAAQCAPVLETPSHGGDGKLQQQTECCEG